MLGKNDGDGAGKNQLDGRSHIVGVIRRGLPWLGVGIAVLTLGASISQCTIALRKDPDHPGPVQVEVTVHQ